MLPNSAGNYVPVTGLNQAMLQYANLWPVANGPELLVNGLPTGTAKAIYNPTQTIHEDFGTTRADYNLSERDTFSAIYTLDNGQSFVGFVAVDTEIERSAAAEYLAGARSLIAFDDLIAQGTLTYDRPQQTELYTGQPNHPLFMLNATGG